MIITCSQCNTRFKVGDDKLAGGPIRVRCSKCNFVFMASGAPTAPPATAPPAMAPHAATTMPPGPPPLSPTPRPSGGPITGMFRAFGAPSDAPSPSGFASTSNRSGIFRAPSSDFRPPPPDPFASLGATAPQSPGYPSLSPPPPGFAPPPSPGFAPSPSPSFSQPPSPSFSQPPSPSFSQPPSPSFSQPPSQASVPFGGAADPFARTMTPGARAMTPGARTMTPGARTMTPGVRGGAVDPFAGASGAPLSDPFGTSAAMGGGAPAVDPFAGVPTAAATPHAMDPFGLGAVPAPAPTFAPPSMPPSASLSSTTTESFAPGELFGASVRPSTEPFAASAPPQPADVGIQAIDDPFAALDATDNADSLVPTSPPRPPPTPEESDPFANIGLDTDDAPPSAPVAERAPPKPRPEPAPSAPRPTASPPPAPTPVESAKLRRIEAAQRVRAALWAALQALIFAAFVAVAVVVARGGTLADLWRGDLSAALGGPRVAGDLAVEDARVRKRLLPSGLEVVTVSGVVRNSTSSTVPGARIEVSFAGAAPMSGWAWSTLDGVDVEAIDTVEQLSALAARRPASASLAPGERAPFVLVGQAAGDGAPASFSVQVTAPPPSPPPLPAAPAEPAPTPG
ncbi:MAG: zinc-ribbon domain-containing protein [Deltaproteobacteria bacterium]|nr:zinc-ribbon domain-containing protein [Deltaproteobacteria bacterium]